MKKLGTYHYKRYAGREVRPPHKHPTVVTTSHTLRVEVLDETQRKYKVKYLGFHANGSGYGYATWVKRDKVVLDEPETVEVRRV